MSESRQDKREQRMVRVSGYPGLPELAHPRSTRQKGLSELAPALICHTPSVGGRKSIRTRAKKGQETE